MASDSLSQLAAAVARQAGEILLEHFGRSQLVTATKSSRTDLVTEADLASEAHVIATVLSARPDDRIISEERGVIAGTSGVEWIIDPLDGTTNFVYGRLEFAVSIAVRVDGELIHGVVFNPCSNELFAATKGDGATCNGVPLTIRPCASVAEALLAVDFSYRSELRELQGESLARLASEVRDFRRFGSPALDLCNFAAGHLDAVFDFFAWPWDFAAGALIASEAGAQLSDLAGRPTFGQPGVNDAAVIRSGLIVNGFVGSSPLIASALRNVISSAVDTDKLERVTARLLAALDSRQPDKA